MKIILTVAYRRPVDLYCRNLGWAESLCAQKGLIGNDVVS